MKILTLTLQLDEDIDTEEYVDNLEAGMASDSVYGDVEIKLISYAEGNTQETE